MVDDINVKKNYVLGFIFNETEDKIALIRKDRPEWIAGFLNGIGGKLEPHELPIDAMIRETEEETTQLIPEEEWKYFAKFSGSFGSVYCYMTHFHDLSLLHCPESEVIEVHNVIDIHSENLAPNISFLVPMALTPNIVCEIHNI